jgi:aspartate racemase
MTGSYFVGRLREHYGMNVLVAEGEHQESVHSALYGELAKGIFLPATREKLKAAMADLVRRGAQASSSDAPSSACFLKPRTARWR